MSTAIRTLERVLVSFTETEQTLINALIENAKDEPEIRWKIQQVREDMGLIESEIEEIKSRMTE